ncbi:MAG: T9SS type A sorting domain-containing protein [Imperialibacter sp.]|uniref:T9SS type A sorting domain-containing protein n=1 Tax=Imperialibacter sp. TaxID=2038411 RepID=UPI0032EE3143
MKTMTLTKRIRLLLPVFVLLAGGALAQKQTTIERSKDKRIHVELRTDEDGSTKTFKKEYKTREEMLADDELKAFLDENELDVQFYGNGKEEGGLHTIILDQSPGVKERIHILSDSDSLKSFFFDGSGTFQFNGTDGAQSYVFRAPKDSEDAVWMFGGMDSLFSTKLTPFDIDSLREVFGQRLEMGGNNGYFFEWNSEDGDKHGSTIVLRKKITISKIEDNEASLDQLSSKKMEKLEPLDLNYYPNPSHGHFTLKMSLRSTDPLQVSIVDLSGKTIYEEEIKTFDGRYSKEFNLTDQPAGIYLLQVVQGKSRLVRKIMIN